MTPKYNPLFTYGTGVLAALLLILAVAFSATGAEEAEKASKESPGKTSEAPEKPVVKKLEPFVLGKCTSATGTSTGTRVKGNPKARASAQKGLDFLAREAKAWQAQNKCYGCHVQAVTVEALTVGHHHQYDINKKDFDTILDGMLTLNGGARTPQGLGHSSPSIAQAAKILGGASFARYDNWVNTGLQKELVTIAGEILAYQKPDGSVVVGWASAPVATGTTQSTAQSMIIWKQAYERTADDQWLTAVQRSEDYLHGVISGWQKTPPQDIQEINYAVMGLLAAGVGNTEEIMVKLSKQLLSLQSPDGSWGNKLAAHDTVPARRDAARNAGFGNVAVGQMGRSVSAPFATGQTLYTLRMLGLTEQDESISKGTKWLIDKQQPSGGWSEHGFGKAEAMWAVLGLVSVDVLTIAVENLKNGQHAQDKHTFSIQVKDNKGAGVQKIEVSLDDMPVAGACGDKLTWTWETAASAEGKHLVEIAATNARGEVSRRIFEIYTGDVYLTQIGSRFDKGGTVMSLRNIAPTVMANTVEVEILTLKDGAAVPTADKSVRTIKQAGQQGAMNFFWDGKDDKGNGLDKGRYIARLSFRDGKGNVRQTEELSFVHNTREAQAADFGQIQGTLAFDDGDIAANAQVELVDEEGNVLQRSVSNRSGNYRFRNLDADKKYKVRVKKDGFRSMSPAVAPKAAEEIDNDMQLIAE